jgi:MFS family permease
MPLTPIRQQLKLSFFDALLYCLMVGLGESYFAAFAVAGQISEVQVGLLTTLPLLIGATLQVFTPFLMRYFRSTADAVVAAVGLQALIFIPLTWMTLPGQVSVTGLLICYSLYFAMGLTASAAWNTWMGQMVPLGVAAAFTAHRSRYSQVGILTGAVLAGLILQVGHRFLGATSPFLFLFGLAGLARAISFYVIYNQNRVRPHVHPVDRPNFREAFTDVWNKPRLRWVFVFFFFFYFVANFSSPYVTPYLLAQAHYNYFEYMIALTVPLVAKFVMAPWTRRRLVKAHAEHVLLAAAACIAPLPSLWYVSDKLAFVIVLQLMSGAAWGVFEVCLSLIFFSRLSKTHKVSILSLYNFLNAVAVLGGASLGAQFLAWNGVDKSAYHWLFVIGGVTRVLCVLPFVYLIFAKGRRLKAKGDPALTTTPAVVPSPAT